MPCGALYGLGLGVSLTRVAMLMKSNGVGLRILNKYILFQEPFYPLAATESFMSFTSIIFAPFLATLSLNELNKTLIEKGFTMPSRIVDSAISGSVYTGAIAAGIYGAYGLASCALGIRDLIGIRKNRNVHDGILRMVIGAAATAIATPFVYHGVTGRNAPTWLTGASCAGIFGLALASRLTDNP